MGGDQLVAPKRRPPIALAARNEDGLALFGCEPIERSLDCPIGAPLPLASARIREDIGPPFFAAGLLRVRPGSEALAAIRPVTSTPTSRRGCAGRRTIGSWTDLSWLGAVFVALPSANLLLGMIPLILFTIGVMIYGAAP
jgi:hypothetical protein